jgi:hypothetical protein
MLAVTETSGLSGLKSDGILGLAPATTSSENTLFIDELYSQGIIDSKVFSFLLSADGDSYFTMGGYNSTYADDTNYTLTWNDLIDT